MGHYYQPEIETAALDSLRKIQDEKNRQAGKNMSMKT